MRTEAVEDAPFLLRLYMSVRMAELEPTGWPEAMKHAFLTSQFALQTRHYAAAYADPDFMILTCGDESVGRLYLAHTDADLRVVDVSLLPERRGGGLGRALLQAVQARAADDGRTVSLSVDMRNPAQNLYRRLGFVEDGTEGPSWRMIWRSPTPPA
ncbi:GNAT family N-acetyltransferase [Azospirillum cavernae]|nr:GNAT family N-acetyltransferase [Azospirillum cavernae]